MSGTVQYEDFIAVASEVACQLSDCYLMAFLLTLSSTLSQKRMFQSEVPHDSALHAHRSHTVRQCRGIVHERLS